MSTVAASFESTSRPPLEPRQALTPRASSGLTIWLATASASRAAEVAFRLRDLDVTVRLMADSQTSRLDVQREQRSAGAGSGCAVWKGGLAPGVLRRVREHIEGALAQKIELRDLARLAGLSACHFARAFRQSTGTPPHRYVMRRRVAAAALLLETTERSLIDIGLAVGFSDQSHFTRAFCRLGGETPGAYRRRHR